MAPKKKPTQNKGAIKLPRKERTPAKDPTPPRNEPELSESSEGEEEEIPLQSTANVAAAHESADENQSEGESDSQSDAEEEEEPQQQQQQHHQQPIEESDSGPSDDDDEDIPDHENSSESESESSDSEEESDDSEIDENVRPSGNSTRVQKPIGRQRRSYNNLGLTLSCKKFARYIRNTSNYRWSKSSIVYLTGCIEYVLGEIVEQIVEECKKDKKKRINPRHLMKTVMNDDDLRNAECWPNVTFAGAGVRGGIHPALVAPLRERQNISAVPGNTQVAPVLSQKKGASKKRASTGKGGTQAAVKKRRLQPVSSGSTE